MFRKLLLLWIVAGFTQLSFSQNDKTPLEITAAKTTVSSMIDKEVVMNGKSDLHITSAFAKNALQNSTVHLNHEDAWLFFDNIRPSVAVDSLLKHVFVNTAPAVNKNNVRVAIYKHGVVIMPHSPQYKPLTVYSGQNFTGDSASYNLFTYYNGLGAMDDRIRSFKLKRGYSATLANNADGGGYSRVFIADNEDILVPQLSYLLDETVSFVRTFNWEYVTKKGWCGTGSGGDADTERIHGTWWYSWSADRESRINQEYVPIKQNAGWPGWSQINSKQNVSHLLGYNEPNRPDQANMTVAQALDQWPEFMKSGLRLGTPSPSDPFGGNGAWLWEFLDSCRARNYRVDYVVIHAYWHKSAQQWYNDLKWVHDRSGGLPIWITEWNNGANWTTETWPTPDRSYSEANANKQLNDLKAILNVLDTTSFVERYSIYNWVQDARAMILGGNLTKAGEYYKNNKSAIAFNRKYEVIPTFRLKRDPGLSISYGANSVALSVKDDNGDFFRGFILEKKVGEGAFVQIFNSDDRKLKSYSDTLDTSLGQVKYRIRTKLVDGTLSNYSPAIGMDMAQGGAGVQFGQINVSNVDWNSVFFAEPLADIPAVVLGAPSNNNINVLMSPRVKFVSRTSRFQIQASAWSYLNVISLGKDETIPYLVMMPGKHQFGDVTAFSGRATANGSSWSNVTFAEPFETVPIVFANQLIAGTNYATSLRIRNVTTTGFQVRIFKEEGVTTVPGTETISYIAMTPGKGNFEGRRFTVGRTADNFVGATARLVNFGDTIESPIFIAQMQTTNDESTAALRNYVVTDRLAYVFKQRERSVTTTTPSAETVGFVVINPEYVVSGVNSPSSATLSISPNPVKDQLQFNGVSFNGELVNIYDLSGSLIKATQLYSEVLDVSDLMPGYYLVRTSTFGTAKFVKF